MICWLWSFFFFFFLEVIEPNASATIPLSFLKFKDSTHAAADSKSLYTVIVEAKILPTYLSKVAFWKHKSRVL